MSKTTINERLASLLHLLEINSIEFSRKTKINKGTISSYIASDTKPATDKNISHS